MRVTIVFKNGYSFSVTCESFTFKQDVFGQLTGYDIKGIKDRKPLYISIEDVMCVYRDRDMEAEDGT
jgi:hypothetical protein